MKKISLTQALLNKISDLINSRDSTKENLPVSFSFTEDHTKVKVYFSQQTAPVFYKRMEDIIDFIDVLSQSKMTSA